MKMAISIERLQKRIKQLEDRLADSEQLIDAIRLGEIDAFAINADNNTRGFGSCRDHRSDTLREWPSAKSVGIAAADWRVVAVMFAVGLCHWAAAAEVRLLRTNSG